MKANEIKVGMLVCVLAEHWAYGESAEAGNKPQIRNGEVCEVVPANRYASEGSELAQVATFLQSNGQTVVYVRRSNGEVHTVLVENLDRGVRIGDRIRVLPGAQEIDFEEGQLHCNDWEDVPAGTEGVIEAQFHNSKLLRKEPLLMWNDTTILCRRDDGTLFSIWPDMIERI